MPGSIRLFVPDALHAGAIINAPEEQSRYIATVMRRAAGETAYVFNGSDGEWVARIRSVRREQVSLEVETQSRPQTPAPTLGLAFGILKRDATELVVQKATELGIAELQPLVTERTNIDRVNPGRLRAIAREAAEQCERLSVPLLHGAARLSAWLGEWPAGRTLYAAVERKAARYPPFIRDKAATLLIGPEGGFTSAELDALTRHPFVVPVTLGPRILRAETAAIVGLALLQAPSDR